MPDSHVGGVVSLEFLQSQPTMVTTGTDNAIKVRACIYSDALTWARCGCLILRTVWDVCFAPGPATPVLQTESSFMERKALAF